MKVYTNMKVIFLDIDGVLHSFNYEKHLIKKSMSPFDNEGAIFDPQCVSALSRLVEVTNVELVIHSSWKDCEDKAKALRIMRNIWSVRNLPGHVFDITPTLSMEDMMRLYGIKATTKWKGYEIKAWLDEHPDCEKFVIIDDQRIYLSEQRNMVVLTDGKDGLTMRNVRQAIKKLDVKQKDYNQHTANAWKCLSKCIKGNFCLFLF